MLLNIGKIIVSPLPCSLPFYTTIAFKILYTTNILRENVFISCFIHFLTVKPIHTFVYDKIQPLFIASNTMFTFMLHLQLIYIESRAPSCMGALFGSIQHLHTSVTSRRSLLFMIVPNSRSGGL